MDFSFNEDQEAIKALSRRIFSDHVNAESHEKAAQAHGWDPALWQLLAQSELLGLGLPEAFGGAGLSILELCILFEQAGAAAAPIPLWSTLMLGAYPIAAFGNHSQQERWLPGIARGEHFVSGAFTSGAPLCVEQTEDEYRLSGIRDGIAMGHVAKRVVIPTPRGVFLVDPSSDSVHVEAQTGTNGMPYARMVMNGAVGEWLAGPDAVPVLEDHAQIGLCALSLGLAQKALHLTAKYTSERFQFGQPIATFQAVSQRAGDCYIDVESMRLPLWRAAWMLSEGRSARREVAVAALFSADGSHRVLCAAQHLHGGMGFVCDYPLHRYFLWAKQLEFMAGGASATLARLGEMVAEAGP
jgi:alkylation response protein AidB-like acyl-CoA dehydrogenase